MQLSARTNTTLEEIASRLTEAQSFAICGHIGPDGDSLGSELALASALRAMGKKVYCLLAKDEYIDPALSYMDGFDQLMLPSQLEAEIDVFVAVDVPTRERLAEATVVLDRAAFSITVDHHEAESVMTDLTYTAPGSASTTLLIWELVSRLPITRGKEIATCAYTGLMTDTGRFQYQNADAYAFAKAAEMVAAGALPHEISRHVYQNRRLASVQLEAITIDRMLMLEQGKIALSWLKLSDFEQCAATKADAEPLIDVLRSLEGVSVACMLKEQDGVVRGSLRAKDDADVASIAREFGGGGHRAAAGFTLEMSIEEAVDTLVKRLTEFVAE